ncbi:MAG: response regulator receiver modulated diguanylate cyclase [Candidatus Magnetoglobus multicellularis str. Araruama]|uniref:Response regulator receiver modulated diguanylate cyclase n=1 Tax=Candidatus Magnetoglobus multicellularis str. Araruama TaxID=890399 RepID=A0A1V1PBP9_9BACT|nr:MAG: response regulator receiver modulated diguanylate cyclase [Candidatus Magnetoglobus multicellularis str. Araruama]
MIISQKQSILIVDDEKNNIDILVNLLKNDYSTLVSKSGKRAINLAKASMPDLILLDIIMPEMDGYDVCRILKSDTQTKDIPVIFVTAMCHDNDESKGLCLGAIDYITKPIRPAIVQARVKNHMERYLAIKELERINQLAFDANPSTGLPGNNSIADAITQALDNDKDVCVIHADLDYFKAFNDKYGFVRGDDIIRFTANTLKEALTVIQSHEKFIGHIGGDDFVLITPSDDCQHVANTIIQRFDQGITQFYDNIDIQQKGITSVNRAGEEQFFPLMSLSLSGVDLSRRSFTQYIEVNDVCAEVKKVAKATPGSCFFMDRRMKDS